MGKYKTMFWKPVRNRVFILYEYLANDWWQICLSFFLVILLGIFAYVFKTDKLGFQAFRAFDLDDKSLQYEHTPSVITGNENIVISTIYGVRVHVGQIPVKRSVLVQI